MRNSIKIFWFLAVYSRTYSAVLQISCHNKNILLLGPFASSFQNRCLCNSLTCLLRDHRTITQSTLWSFVLKPDWMRACSSQPWWWAARGGDGPLKATFIDGVIYWSSGCNAWGGGIIYALMCCVGAERLCVDIDWLELCLSLWTASGFRAWILGKMNNTLAI